MTQRKPSPRKKAIIWAAVAIPGVLAFMANTSAKEAASNLASWIELLGLPVPDFLTTAAVDEQVTQAALTFYALLAAASSLMVLKRAEPGQNATATT